MIENSKYYDFDHSYSNTDLILLLYKARENDYNFSYQQIRNSSR
ncbi:hypothetical protein ACVWYN_003218 [Pedobacter sp. UYP24]